MALIKDSTYYSAWIGLIKKANLDSVYVWDDGTSFTFNSRANNPTDVDSEDRCAYIYSLEDDDDYWVFFSCESYPY